jgi:hypothetical protein
MIEEMFFFTDGIPSRYIVNGKEVDRQTLTGNSGFKPGKKAVEVWRLGLNRIHLSCGRIKPLYIAFLDVSDTLTGIVERLKGHKPKFDIRILSGL